MRKFTITAPGKVILYGEHAVVYGKTAVAASLDLRTVLRFKELPGDHECVNLSMPKIHLQLSIPLQQIVQYFFDPRSPKFDNGHEKFYNHVQRFVQQYDYNNVHQRHSLEAFFYLFASISQREQIQLFPFEVHVNTDLSIGSGLGSSASYAVCLSACFVHLSAFQKSMPVPFDSVQLEMISKYALNCERIMHGTPSGIDNSVCTYGSIIEFRKGDPLYPISGVKSMRVLLIDTRVQRSTKALVERLADLKCKYPEIFDPIIESIDNVARRAVEVIKDIKNMSDDFDDSYYKAYDELMTLVNVNQGLLATCQVSHPSLDSICTEAKKYGLAAKLTGAGGGGYAYILLLPNTPTETITSITKKLRADGYVVILTNLGSSGVEISFPYDSP